jgi:hypothetical protein
VSASFKSGEAATALSVDGLPETVLLFPAGRNRLEATQSSRKLQTRPFAVARQPLKPPPRLAEPKKPRPTPKPAAPPPPDPFAGLERLGSWVLLGKDSLGKRAVGRCVGYGAIHEISLVGGDVPSCGCAEARRVVANSFVHELVQVEARVATKRHRGRR